MVLVPATKRAEKFLHDPNPNPNPTPDPDPHRDTNPDPIPNPNPTPNPSRFLHDLTRKARAPPLHQPTAHAASEALKQLQLAGLGPLQHCLLAYRVFLEGEHFQALLLRFLSLVAAWLLHLGDGAEGAPAKFALLPEACVTALCEVRVLG